MVAKIHYNRTTTLEKREKIGTLSNDDEYVYAKSGSRPLFTGNKERGNVNLSFA